MRPAPTRGLSLPYARKRRRFPRAAASAARSSAAQPAGVFSVSLTCTIRRVPAAAGQIPDVYNPDMLTNKVQ